MQLRFIVRGIGHRPATIWTSSTATLFILFAAGTRTAFVSTKFGCLQPDCLPAEGAAIQSPQQSLALGKTGSKSGRTSFSASTKSCRDYRPSFAPESDSICPVSYAYRMQRVGSVANTAVLGRGAKFKE